MEITAWAACERHLCLKAPTNLQTLLCTRGRATFCLCMVLGVLSLNHRPLSVPFVCMWPVSASFRFSFVLPIKA